MKIVHLAETMEFGGAEKIISLLCHWQRQQGHEASVHCLYAAGPLAAELSREGIEVVVHNPQGPGSGRRAAAVYRRLKCRTPDVLHCHNATAAILGAIPARMAGIRSIVVTRHGNVAPPYLLRRELKFAAASRYCNWIVAVCEQARNNLIAAPFAARNKIVRVYNAASEPRRNGTPPPAKSGLTLLHVGRLSPVKDQETLLRAFAIARTRTRDLRLWIVGGGSLRAKLESVAQQIGLNGSVTFFGEQSDVSPFLMAADLFVLSSVTEGVPISLLEALAAGLPSVVTSVGGMTEVAGLSDATITAPAADPVALAAAIDKMANSRDQFPRLKDAAQQCFNTNFTLDRMANEYMALYGRSDSRR